MIPKPFHEIVWSDIDALVASSREEDDTIEFKSAFKGGSDFLSLSEAKQKAATESIAKEVIAFLNSHGGDLIIGISEAANETGAAQGITPVDNVAQTADRLAQSLSARIEPFQSIVAVRGIVDPRGDGSSGTILIRVPASLRAPHRSRDSRECYVRRGKESVPMPMDEIHDVTLNRASRRSERLAVLTEMIQPIYKSGVGGITLPPTRMHIRCVYVPMLPTEFTLGSTALRAFLADDPVLYSGERQEKNDVAFRGLHGNWKPVLRGRRVFEHQEYADRTSYAGKEIYEFGTLVTDIADDIVLDVRGKSVRGMYLIWIIGFLANSLASFEAVMKVHPEWSDGILRVGIKVGADSYLITGDNVWTEIHELVPGVTLIPDFEISRGEGMNEIFQQLQIDVCALAALECGTPYSMIPPS